MEPSLLMVEEVGDILSKAVVSFVSLSCIVQTLWDLSSYDGGSSVGM